jgi:hypothetical protein
MEKKTLLEFEKNASRKNLPDARRHALFTWTGGGSALRLEKGILPKRGDL